MGAEREETAPGGAAAAAPTSSPTPPPPPPPPPPSIAHQLGKLSKHSGASTYVARFLGEPFLPAWAAHPALRQLLAMRKCAKELSEAYGAARQAVALLGQLRQEQQQQQPQPPQQGRGTGGLELEEGQGAVLLDVCSGKGLTATLLSFLLPRARVVMLDSNSAMQLAHVAARPNLAFEEFDLFATTAGDTLARLARGGGGGEDAPPREEGAPVACVAIGTHLCGTLSPRLVDLAVRVPEIGGLVLCPCCLKGSLGYKITRAARARGTDAYRLAVGTMAAQCRAQLDEARGGAVREAAAAAAAKDDDGGGGVAAVTGIFAAACDVGVGGVGGAGSGSAAPADVRTFFDDQVISPKNGFIVALTTTPRVDDAGDSTRVMQ